MLVNERTLPIQNVGIVAWKRSRSDHRENLLTRKDGCPPDTAWNERWAVTRASLRVPAQLGSNSNERIHRGSKREK